MLARLKSYARTYSLTWMVPLRGLKACWCIAKATLAMAVVATSLVFASGAHAHSATHTVAALGPSPGQGNPVSIDLGTSAMPQIISVSWQASDDSCPEPAHDRADHIGCCSGSGSCVSAAGALIAPDQGPNLPPHMTVLHASPTPVPLGIKIIPADPPPRALI